MPHKKKPENLSITDALNLNALRRLQAESQKELDALLPSPFGDGIRTG